MTEFTIHREDYPDAQIEIEHGYAFISLGFISPQRGGREPTGKVTFPARSLSHAKRIVAAIAGHEDLALQGPAEPQRGTS